MQEALWRNYRISLSSEFASEMVQTIRAYKAAVIRPHVAGDFYSQAYARKWHEVMTLCPSTRFYLYTRSWRIPAIRAVLMEMSELPNLIMWWSADHQTHTPVDPPAGVRIAYMQAEDSDVAEDIDLYFRNERKKSLPVLKQVNGTMVCPVENGVTETTCSKCQICFTAAGERMPRPTKRRSLTLV